MTCSPTPSTIRSRRPPPTPTRPGAWPTWPPPWTARGPSSSERFAEDADLIGGLRERMWTGGRLVSRVRDGQQEAGAKFADYFEFAEPFTQMPSHRILALLRGEKEEVLDLELDPGEADAAATRGGASDYEVRIARALRHRRPGPARRPLAARHRPLGLADPDQDPAQRGPAHAAVAEGRGRRRRRVRRQPARPAARRPGRRPGHHGPGPRLPHRREGRRGRRHRQGGRHRDDLPA